MIVLKYNSIKRSILQVTKIAKTKITRNTVHYNLHLLLQVVFTVQVRYKGFPYTIGRIRSIF